MWDADKVRDDIRGYMVDELGDAEGVLILDDTGGPKKGDASAGTQRQYTGTAGRTGNSQVAVFLPTPPVTGTRWLTGTVYLPRSLDRRPVPLRRRRCARPRAVRHEDHPGPANADPRRAGGCAGGLGHRGEFYGGDRGLRRDLQARGMGYVLAVARSHRVTTSAAVGPQRADQVAAALSRRRLRTHPNIFSVRGLVMLETGRLLLRPWRLADAVVRHELWTERDPRVPPHRRIDAAGHPTVADLEESIGTNASPTGLLAVERKATGDVVGYCGLIDSGRGPEQPELAFELVRRVWGQGYATEASLAVIDRARSSGCRRLWATVWDWNTASGRVLAKVGFTETGRTEVDPVHGTTLFATRTL